MTELLETPWMADAEVAVIDGILRDEFAGRAKALEFGAGGSTMRFAPLAASWISIEHSSEWAERVAGQFGDGAGVRVELVPPEWPHSGFSAAQPGQFASYIASAGELCPAGGFDFVLVDGRARIECMLALATGGLLASGAVVAIHDFRRDRYLDRLVELLKYYELRLVLTEGVPQGLAVFVVKSNGFASVG